MRLAGRTMQQPDYYKLHAHGSLSHCFAPPTPKPVARTCPNLAKHGIDWKNTRPIARVRNFHALKSGPKKTKDCENTG